MAKAFEDLKAWQDARVFVKSIYNLTSKPLFSKDYGLRDQIQRAAVSIMNNISEGYERDNNKELIKILGYSKGSAGEVRSMLYVGYDLNYLTKEEFEQTLNLAMDIIKQIANFIKYLKAYNMNN